MAANESIRSPFSAQPRFPKLRIYEYLHLLNEKFQNAVQILQRLEKCPGLRREFLRSFQVEVEDVRAPVNFEVLECLSDREQHDWARFGKLRRQRDRQFEDPDDVYFSVARREAQRKQQGLPSRLSIIPCSTVADDNERLEVQRERKKRRTKKRGE